MITLENLLAVGNSNIQPFSLIYTYYISILVVSVLTAYLQFFLEYDVYAPLLIVTNDTVFTTYLFK